MAAAKFDGFSRDLLNFFDEVERNNNKQWFDDHRDDYQALYVEPAKAFVTAMEKGLKKLSPTVMTDARIGPVIGRINRDTRFSANKTPYKTALMIRFRDPGPVVDGGGGKDGPGYMFRIGNRGWHEDRPDVVIGGGWFGMDRSYLPRFRELVADDKSGAALVRAINKAKKAGFDGPHGHHYKKVPKGHDPDHKRAELLKHNAMFMGQGGLPPEEIFTADAVDYVLAKFRVVKPLNDWLVQVKI